MARGKTIDRALAELVLQMKEKNPKLTTAQIGTVLEIDPTTVGRIIQGGSWEGFCRWKEEKARKEREKNRKAAAIQEKLDELAEEMRPLPGQIRMELPETPEKPEMSEQVKMMRFMAGQVDKLVLKLDHINDTLSQILRAVRRE